MSSPPKPLTGRCLCGGVTYRADAEPVVQAVCHCTDCQRQTGNPYSAIVAVPEASFSYEGSTLGSYSTTGDDHGSQTKRNFCTACGSPVFSSAAVVPGMIFLKVGSLDDPSWFAPTVEVWTSSAQPWTPSFGETARMERGPG